MKLNKWVLFVGLVVVVIGIDQVSKAWVLENVPLGTSWQAIPALYPFFQVTFSQNTGAAFGMFQDFGMVLLVLALLISLGILVFYSRLESHERLMQIGLVLIWSGAIGNVIDRIQHGFVVDFVQLTIPGIISNVSNFADHFIILGVVILLIDNLLKDFKQRREARLKTESVPTES
jgi:signal peptidase II